MRRTVLNKDKFSGSSDHVEEKHSHELHLDGGHGVLHPLLKGLEAGRVSAVKEEKNHTEVKCSVGH